MGTIRRLSLLLVTIITSVTIPMNSAFAESPFTGLTTGYITGKLEITTTDYPRSSVYKIIIRPYRAGDPSEVYTLNNYKFDTIASGKDYECQIGWTPGGNKYAVVYADCTKKETGDLCGNGTKNSGEECDYGSVNGVCPATCSRDCKLNNCPEEDSGSDGSESQEEAPAEPVNVGFYGKVETVDKPFWAPNCDKDGKHTDGILKGVPCNEAIDSKEEVVRIVKNIISGYLLPIVGVLFITVIVIGGLAYITSSGNKERVDRAKKILTSGIIGLLIVTLSYTIIQIFAKILGGNVG